MITQNVMRLTRPRLRRRSTRIVLRIGPARARLTEADLALLRDEIQRLPASVGALPSALIERLDSGASRAIVLTDEEMSALVGLIRSCRLNRSDLDFDLGVWNLANVQLLCESVLAGVGRRKLARLMAKQRGRRLARKRQLDHEAFLADPPPRSKVAAYGVVFVSVSAFLFWGFFHELHQTRDHASKPVWLAGIVLCWLYVTVPLIGSTVGLTLRPEPWVTIYRFLDSLRLTLSITAGGIAFVLVQERVFGGAVSLEFYRASVDLLLLVAIALAVEARFSSASRGDVPFRGVSVLFGFGWLAYGEYVCLHAIAVRAADRHDLAVVASGLVGAATALALLAALGPMRARSTGDAAVKTSARDSG